MGLALHDGGICGKAVAYPFEGLGRFFVRLAPVVNGGVGAVGEDAGHVLCRPS